MLKQSTLLFLLLLTPRLVSVFAIKPGNAPDEHGHLTIVKALSQGKVFTFKESMAYERVSYAIYNPAPYFPYVVGMKLAYLVNPNWKIPIEGPIKGVSHASVYAARLGGLLWFLLFAFFLLCLADPLPTPEKWLFVCTLGLLPQLTFVQSYVNLDAMGVGVMAYLVWAVHKERWKHVAFATALVSVAKLNYYCLGLLPLSYLVVRFRDNTREGFRHLLQITIPTIMVGLPWLLYNYFIVTGEFRSFLGLNALGYAMIPEELGGLRIFCWHFFNLSLWSAFGVFSFLNVRLPMFVYSVWTVGFVSLGMAVMIYCMVTQRFPKKVTIPLFIVFSANWFTHYAAAYRGSYQPQGRYLFPAILILLGYVVFFWWAVVKRFRSRWIYCLPALFMLISAVMALFYSVPDPIGHAIPDMNSTVNTK